MNPSNKSKWFNLKMLLLQKKAIIVQPKIIIMIFNNVTKNLIIWFKINLIPIKITKSIILIKSN